MEKRKLSDTLGRNEKWCIHYVEQCGDSLKYKIILKIKYKNMEVLHKFYRLNTLSFKITVDAFTDIDKVTSPKTR